MYSCAYHGGIRPFVKPLCLPLDSNPPPRSYRPAGIVWYFLAPEAQVDCCVFSFSFVFPSFGGCAVRRQRRLESISLQT